MTGRLSLPGPLRAALALVLGGCLAVASGCRDRAGGPGKGGSSGRSGAAGSGTMAGVSAASQDTSAWPTPDDSLLEQIVATLGFRLGLPAGIWVSPGGDQVLFRRSDPRSFTHDLYAFDVASGKTERILSAETLLKGSAEKLSPEEKARRERMRLSTRGITGFSASRDGGVLLVPLSSRLFLYDRTGGATRELHPGGVPVAPILSPDGKHVAYSVDDDLRVLDIASGDERQLTHKTSPDVTNGLAEFAAQEEMDRRAGTWWSPDSRYLAYQETDNSQVETWYLADATHPDRAPASFHYPQAGTKNAVVRLGVVAQTGGHTVWVDWDNKAFPYLARVTWTEGAPLTIVIQNRAQTEERVLAVDPRTGKTHQLLVEHDDAWINLDPTMPRWLPDGSGFLWSTERGGGWQLELRGKDGALVRTLTEAGLGYRSLAGLDEARGAAWVVASADPRDAQIVRVPLDGSAIEQVTSEPGLHGVTVGRHTGVYVLSWRDPKGVVHDQVRRPDGAVVGELPQVAEKPSHLPDPEMTSVEVGGRTHYAVVLRPETFDKTRRYPVVVSCYGGPHVTVVHDDRMAYLLDQWLADAGFVVVKMDGRGTPYRGRAWERVIKDDLITVPLADQVAILEALGKTRPEMDLNRVGITGWSFGGYLSAMAILLRPDVFKAAVAGAPVTDWRYYDTHYTERYMGLPEKNKAGYDRGSALVHAGELSRPLLLVHGTTDDNVYFTHSLLLSQKLFLAGKTFDMLPLAGFTHMVPDPTVKKALQHRILDFFRRTLGPPVPR